MTIPKPTFRDLLLLIVIAVFIIYAWRGCGDRKTWEQKVVEKEAQRKKDIDSLQNALAIHIKLGGGLVAKLEGELDSIEGEAEVFRYERNQSWVELGKTKKSADQLVAKIREMNGADSIACLDLADNYTNASRQVVYYKTKSDELIAKLDTAGAYKDSIIKEERELKEHALEVGLQTAEAYSALHASFKRLSPHNSVWVGAEGSYSPFGSTIGGVMAFQNKKGTQYLAGAGLNSKDVGYYFKAGVLFKISFRKK